MEPNLILTPSHLRSEKFPGAVGGVLGYGWGFEDEYILPVLLSLGEDLETYVQQPSVLWTRSYGRKPPVIYACIVC